jgi:hypothetical protein
MYVIPPDTTYRMYSAVNGFLPVELLAAVERPTGCGEVVMVGRLFLGTSVLQGGRQKG